MSWLARASPKGLFDGEVTMKGKENVWRRRLRSARLRPETTSGDALRLMVEHLSKMLGVTPQKARGYLLRMGRYHHPAA